MNKTLQEKQTFTKIDYTDKNISNREYDACAFIDCDFSKCDLTNIDFVDCKFENCNFSMVKFINTGLKNASFTGCKLLGCDFTRCNDFLLSFYFEKCFLDYSSFHRKKIIKTIFKDCAIKEVDFSYTDLTGSNFLNCDLTRTIFQHTILEKVDFRTANNFYFDLEMNKIKKAKFSSLGVIGLLEKYQIVIE
jgi:uncharacterized protein YjbI with pentapeptide repeats